MNDMITLWFGPRHDDQENIQWTTGCLINLKTIWHSISEIRKSIEKLVALEVHLIYTAHVHTAGKMSVPILFACDAIFSRIETYQVLKSGARPGWRRSVGPIVW